MNQRQLSLKTKLLSLNVAISVVALTMFGIMAKMEVDAIHHGREVLADSIVESYIDKIDRNLFERYGDVQAFAMSEPARSGNPQRVVDFMNDMMGTYAPIYDLMIVVDSTGKVVAVNTNDKSGKPIESQGLLGKNYSQEEWFKAAMAGKIEPGQSLVEDLHVDSDVAQILKNSGEVMNFTAPIREKSSGKILGVWTNRMSWPDVVQNITKEELAKVKSESMKDVFAFLVDSQGRYLLHPDTTQILKSSKDEFETLSSDAKKDTVTRTLGVDSSYFKGEVFESFTVSRGYSIYPGRGWFAQIQISSADPAINESFWLIGIATLLMIASFFFGNWTISKVSRSLMGIIENLNKESVGVRSASSNISQGSQDLASASTEQASALQETAASIEETNAMVKKSSENAERSREISQKSHEAAMKGKTAVDGMIHAIEEINTSNDRVMKQVEESNRQITDIVKVITEIGNKTKVINDIVFQTKLLSFNASVEAARAGEHGKGFAVVAEEVGNLAQMSGNASKEIADMLSGSIQRVESIVTETKRSVEQLVSDGKVKVESGIVIARQCGDVLEEVVKNVADVNGMIGEISTAAREQALGVTEITKAMNQLDQVTHQNASTSQQTATLSSQLAKQSESLFGVVQSLKQIVHGSSEAADHVAEVLRRPETAAAAKKDPEVKVDFKSFKKKEEKAPAKNTALKKAVGTTEIPSENDPRFKDI